MTNPLVPLGIVGVIAVVGYIFFTGGFLPDGPGPAPTPELGDICDIPSVDGNPSCLTINTFSYDFPTQQLSMTFTYREPDCPLCTGNVGNLRIVVIQSSGARQTYEYGPGEQSFNGNLGDFGIMEWWVSDDMTRGVNRFRIDTSGSLIELDTLLNS